MGPWCVGGDFNTIANASERLGGAMPILRAMEDFNSMISQCDLHDIGFFGGAYTWNRGNLWQRLDRILFNNDWIAKFHMTHVEHLSRTTSDHAPLLLSINANKSFISSAFKFQNMWLLNQEFLNIVGMNWEAPIFPNNNIYGMTKLWNKLSRLKQVLRWWNKHVFKNLFDNIKEAENEVVDWEVCVASNPLSDNISNLNKAKLKLSALHEQEEIYWQQKATTRFLVEGDRNTKFFHTMYNKKRVKNYIFKILDKDGRILEDENSIINSGVEHFRSIFNSNFTSSAIENPYIVPNCISDSENFMLTKPPLEEEIWNIMQTMNLESVAGPDGFTIKFFVNTWHITKVDIIEAVNEFFSGKPYIKFFSSTNIVLIPKKDLTNDWNDFRPISLCSFFNKLVSKIISSRLVNILPRIISHNQTGFVKGRSILDNILLTQEIAHDINVKSKGGNIIFKLDITKAYDNLNWEFLYKVLALFGFSDDFILLVKNSIENCYFSVIINGANHGFFKSTQGLRQGDPLSPALFIIDVDYLSRSLEELFMRHPSLHYRTMGGIPISHLCFADDFIIFSNACLNNIKILVKFLEGFYKVSGLNINRNKSNFIVANSVKLPKINEIISLCKFNCVYFPIKYLGTPIFKGRKKASIF
ncbi:hypothetical protein KFK09_010794 [Dendrobium nobile]|uniref:Reverse transcriptase domain-containing protein n=1 Tax=Dendrobium nobile TaxID=94219 RepID=A0A8T3BCR1_DENNO|nr:hypothetical protein KFK09_010794 [Dendrobium nobile]